MYIASSMNPAYGKEFAYLKEHVPVKLSPALSEVKIKVGTPITIRNDIKCSKIRILMLTFKTCVKVILILNIHYLPKIYTKSKIIYKFTRACHYTKESIYLTK